MRASPDEIREKRAGRRSGILVTGATGFLGSHLAVELLRRGYRVYILARAWKNLTARDRVRRLLEWFGMDAEKLENLRVLEVHFEDPSLGLSEEDLVHLRKDVDEIIHCASDTSFSERKRPGVERANVANLRNLLSFAARIQCSFFHHLSTAYVAGKRKGICREEIADNGGFMNVYEETKHIAENLVTSASCEEGIGLNIYRPSIVYGDSRDGRTFRFSAVYYPLRTVFLLKEIFQKDILQNGGRKAGELGIKMDQDGSIHLPIRLECTNGGGINLIPVDFFVRAFMSIMEECVEGGIFHIVNPETKPIDDLIDYVKRFLSVRGLRAVPREIYSRSPRNGLEILFEQYVEAYRPYMKDERIFNSDNADAILSRRGIACPDFDYEIFSRCMQYAVESDWGRRLFPRT